MARARAQIVTPRLQAADDGGATGNVPGHRGQASLSTGYRDAMPHDACGSPPLPPPTRKLQQKNPTTKCNHKMQPQISATQACARPGRSSGQVLSSTNPVTHSPERSSSASSQAWGQHRHPNNSTPTKNSVHPQAWARPRLASIPHPGAQSRPRLPSRARGSLPRAPGQNITEQNYYYCFTDHCFTVSAQGGVSRTGYGSALPSLEQQGLRQCDEDSVFLSVCTRVWGSPLSFCYSVLFPVKH